MWGTVMVGTRWQLEFTDSYVNPMNKSYICVDTVLIHEHCRYTVKYMNIAGIQ